MLALSNAATTTIAHLRVAHAQHPSASIIDRWGRCEALKTGAQNSTTKGKKVAHEIHTAVALSAVKNVAHEIHTAVALSAVQRKGEVSPTRHAKVWHHPRDMKVWHHLPS